MLADNLQQVSLSGRQFDVCIIGSGPAGMTIATELGARGRSVLLLEAGPAQYDEGSQAMFDAEVVSPFKLDLDANRLRYLGGASNHWGGFCQALEAVDFESKVASVDTEWPIRRSDLEPYLGRAERILELPPLEADRPFGDDLRVSSMRYSPPVNFGRKYRPTLERMSNVIAVLQACVVGMEEGAGEIVALEVCDPANARFAIRARRYVLCAGGVENSRLLLWANIGSKGRVVKEPRSLGRYWTEHPHFTIGEAILDESAPFKFDQWSIAWVNPNASMLRAKGVLNAGLRITRKNRESSRQLVAELACVAPELGRWAMAKLNRRLFCGAMLRASWEQAPQAYNRVVLGYKRDRYGMPQAELHWRLSDFDRRTIRSTAISFAEQMIRSQYGRVRLDPWVLGQGSFPADDEIKGNHHMGGTRMSADPLRGVVDADCRVHGLSNLYVSYSQELCMH